MKFNRLVLLGLGMTCLLCLSCSKEEEKEVTPIEEPKEKDPQETTTPTIYDYNALVSQHNHLLNSYSSDGNTIYWMEYDNQRRLTSVKGSESYSIGSFVIDYDKRTITEKDHIYNFSLNKQGYIDTLVCDYDVLGIHMREMLAYEYDGDYLKKASFQFFENGKPGYAGIDYNEATYQYESGLLSIVRYGGVTWEFSYGEIANPDRLSPVSFCPLMVFFNMPTLFTIGENDMLYYTGLFGKVSDKLPDTLFYYTDYSYDIIKNNYEEYQKNKDYYDFYVNKFTFSYTTDENGIASMSTFWHNRNEWYSPFNFAFRYEK